MFGLIVNSRSPNSLSLHRLQTKNFRNLRQSNLSATAGGTIFNSSALLSGILAWQLQQCLVFVNEVFCLNWLTKSVMVCLTALSSSFSLRLSVSILLRARDRWSRNFLFSFSISLTISDNVSTPNFLQYFSKQFLEFFRRCVVMRN